MKEIKNITPNELRNCRNRANYSQSEVTFLSNGKISTSQLSKWERGLSKPSVENLYRLSIIYKTLCDQFYPSFREQFVNEVDEQMKMLSELKDSTGQSG